jgi:hypothetical protein
LSLAVEYYIVEDDSPGDVVSHYLIENFCLITGGARFLSMNASRSSCGFNTGPIRRKPGLARLVGLVKNFFPLGWLYHRRPCRYQPGDPVPSNPPLLKGL